MAYIAKLISSSQVWRFLSCRPVNIPRRRVSTERYKDALRTVPQPVVIVTGATYDAVSKSWYKRGMTCSSFTSVSLNPPIISFAMNNPSRMHDLLLKTKEFGVHVLSAQQISHCLHFAKAADDNVCQFTEIPHHQENNIPIIADTNAVLKCKLHSVSEVGDHFVWNGSVHDVIVNDNIKEPLLFHARKLQSIGDSVFIKLFEDTTLPFMDWTHEAHIRMAWNYISEYGKAEAVSHIKTGIKRFNERNKDKITHGYHESITEFYIHMVCHAVTQTPTQSFDDFIETHSYLKDTSLLLQYYSPDLIRDVRSKTSFILPDRKDLPTT